MHACAQDPAGLYAKPAEPDTGLQFLRQLFGTSACRGAAGSDANGQAQAASAASTSQPQQPQTEQPAGNAEGQPGNGAAAQQQPQTLEGLQAELDAQRAAVEQRAAEVCIGGSCFDLRHKPAPDIGMCTSIACNVRFAMVYPRCSSRCRSLPQKEVCFRARQRR